MTNDPTLDPSLCSQLRPGDIFYPECHNSGDFEAFFDEIVAHERATLCAKREEYAGESRRLHNFYDGADFTRKSPAETLWGYLTKHLVSCREIAFGKKVSRATLREKIGDARNYLALLESLVLEGGE